MAALELARTRLQFHRLVLCLTDLATLGRKHSFLKNEFFIERASVFSHFGVGMLLEGAFGSEGRGWFDDDLAHVARGMVVL